jgi:multidrug efflux pump subunit AcrA (membrane-fusion protein)
VHRSARNRAFAAGVAALLAVSGCERRQQGEVAKIAQPLTVQVVKPQLRDIARVVGQPSFVESYERTSIYPKLTGYIKKWYVDIGDRVKKDQVLADLFVPEVEEDCQTKYDAFELAKEQVALANEQVKVADANVKAAAARLDAARKILDRYEAQVARWDKEVTRLKGEASKKAVDAQVLAESENQLASSAAARDAALAEIERAEAELKAKTAALAEDKVSVEVAEANVEVARHDWLRVKASVDWYLKLYAPFEGVVVARNANTWDFVLPATGDPTADRFRDPDRSPSGRAAPVYVVDRTDVVRVFVDIPEEDANDVRIGTKASVVAKAFRDEPVLATVTRTSWALNVQSRTLRAEIDLPNTGGNLIPDDLPATTRQALAQVKLPETNTEILPGMYAYGRVTIERPQVRALPAAALTHVGDQSFYWSCENGKAVRVEVQTGVSDGEWIEIASRRVRAPAVVDLQKANAEATPEVAADKLPPVFGADAEWAPLDGSENVIVSDLSSLTEGAAVEPAPGTEQTSLVGRKPFEREIAAAPSQGGRDSLVD